MIASNGYYTFSNLMGFDPWKNWYLGVVGGRGIGKTVSAQSLVLKSATYNGDQFVWVRSNDKALKKCLKEFPDNVVKSKIKKSMSAKGDKFYLGKKIMGHFYSLSQAHNVKGASVDWKQIRYIIFDEFNLEPTEKKNFDLVDAFISIVQTVGRPEERIKLHQQGIDVKPLTVIFMGNDTQEASPLLERFGFIPETYGKYGLPNKKLILEYVDDGVEWKRLRTLSPLSVLRKNSDRQLGESTIDLKINTLSMGQLENPKHLYRVWTSLNNVVDVFSHKGGIWISKGMDSRVIIRLHGYSSYVVNPKDLRSGRVYYSKVIEGLRTWLFSGITTFSDQMTGRLFIDCVAKGR